MVDSGFAYDWPPELKPPLPSRLRDVLVLLLEGQATKDIAVALGKSIHTIEAYRSSLILVFGVQTTEQVIAVAARTFWLHKIAELGSLV